MRVFGIDCGTDCTGYGVVEWAELGVKSGNGSSREPCLVALASGGIRLPKGDTMPRKLAFVYRELMLLLEAHRPEVVAIEEVFYSANVKSALKLGQVRGVALLAAASCGLPVAEYAPLKIKSSVVGYGLAQKEQVQYMVTRLLRLERVPEPADAADALAVAICHLHTQQTLSAQAPAARAVAR